MKCNNSVNVLMVLALLLGAMATNALAGSALEKVKEKGVITVGNSPDYPPFESIGDNGDRVGFDIDLMNAMAGKMGVKVRWVTREFAAIVTAVQSGQVDMGMSGFSITPERKKQVDFSASYIASGQGIVTRPDSTIASIEDLKGKKIAVQMGTTGDSKLTRSKAHKSSNLKATPLPS